MNMHIAEKQIMIKVTLQQWETINNNLVSWGPGTQESKHPKFWEAVLHSSSLL